VTGGQRLEVHHIHQGASDAAPNDLLDTEPCRPRGVLGPGRPRRCNRSQANQFATFFCETSFIGFIATHEVDPLQVAAVQFDEAVDAHNAARFDIGVVNVVPGGEAVHESVFADQVEVASDDFAVQFHRRQVQPPGVEKLFRRRKNEFAERRIGEGSSLAGFGPATLVQVDHAAEQFVDLRVGFRDAAFGPLDGVEFFSPTTHPTPLRFTVMFEVVIPARVGGFPPDIHPG